MSVPLIALLDLRKDFSGVHVLKGIDLAFEAGEIHGLLGENGAGKSTLIKILTGVYAPSSGQVLMDGKPVTIHRPIDAHRLGLGAVYQDSELVGSYTVAENIVLGNEPRGPWINRRRIRAEAVGIMDQIGLTLDPDRPAASLTAAEMQMVTLATLFHRKYRLIILDEPTARLSAPETRLLFQLIARFRQQGISIVYISHRLNEIKELCDRATILRDGMVSGSLQRHEIEEEIVTKLMVNRSMAELDIGNPGLAQDRVVLELDGLTTDRLSPLSLTVRAGEILGITGPLGAGMEQIERSLGGLGAYRGDIRVDGVVRPIRSPHDSRKAGIALIPEDRRKQALFPNLSLAENVSLPAMSELAKLGLIAHAAANAYANSVVQRLAIHPQAPERPMRYFSGGNQQKAVIGKWLKREARAYIFVEPTSGVDVGAIRQIYEIILGLARSGAAVIVISTSVKELLALSETIAVIHHGAISALLPRADCTRDSLLAMTISATAPSVAA
ncbi:sugar ABC transporter ATP-binding protein [Acidisoma cellulosilytica]|uniref:Sugar ABC transporter ATP-binding protein n=1 Tax=Acidisoma cellulosilyticum TaxID=2802395 RepID=A0A963Z335_9PROT|nr:sugar ABC transporter ATP-binding protein [Acidisoma cellulosilyticum]MCB8881082.1 sugar ABC transporter ATP-binding protein [Acidisoma cellulosilyticum]